MRKALFSISPFVLSFLLISCGANNNNDLPACGDGLDNDEDAFIDAADPGCSNAEDDDETDAQCADGLDNDFDGLGDLLDPDCANNPNAEANAAALPDLIMDEDLGDLQATLDVIQGVTEQDGEFKDGCFSGTGDRDVLLFNGIIENVGTADLVVGNTPSHQPPYTQNNNLQQLEFAGWLDYKFLDNQRTVVASGHKGSFCMLDLAGVGGFNNPPKFDDCDQNQGITVGQADIYSIGLPCQFVDVTGLPAGDYTLQVEVNITKQLPESNYTNNVQEYPITIP